MLVYMEGKISRRSVSLNLFESRYELLRQGKHYNATKST